MSSHKGNCDHKKTYTGHMKTAESGVWQPRAQKQPTPQLSLTAGQVLGQRLLQSSGRTSSSHTLSSDFRLPESSEYVEAVLLMAMCRGNLGNDFSGFILPIESKTLKRVPPSPLIFSRGPPLPSSAEALTATQASCWLWVSPCSSSPGCQREGGLQQGRPSHKRRK